MIGLHTGYIVTRGDYKKVVLGVSLAIYWELVSIIVHFPVGKAWRFVCF